MGLEMASAAVEELTGQNMKPDWKRHACVCAFLLLLCAAMPAWAQGPPYQTDDPVPVDLHHYEFYIFGSADGTPVEMDSVGPALEFNWGAIPRVTSSTAIPRGRVRSGACRPPGKYPRPITTNALARSLSMGARANGLPASRHRSNPFTVPL